MPKPEELFLRPIEKKDAFGVYLWELDKETQLVTQSEIKVSLENVYALIEQQTDVHNSCQLRMMICLSNRNAAIGMIDLYDVDFDNGYAYVGVLIAEKPLRQKVRSTSLNFNCSLCKEGAEFGPIEGHYSAKK